jgi:nucleoid DNA-binding protein
MVKKEAKAVETKAVAKKEAKAVETKAVAKKEVKVESKRLHKYEFVKALKEKCEIPNYETANAVFEAVCELIAKFVVEDGKHVKLDGVGTFRLHEVAEKKVFNPKEKTFRVVKNAKYLRFCADGKVRRELKV